MEGQIRVSLKQISRIVELAKDGDAVIIILGVAGLVGEGDKVAVSLGAVADPLGIKVTSIVEVAELGDDRNVSLVMSTDPPASEVRSPVEVVEDGGDVIVAVEIGTF